MARSFLNDPLDRIKPWLDRKYANMEAGTAADTISANAGMLNAQTNRSLAPSQIGLNIANTDQTVAETAEIAPNAQVERQRTQMQAQLFGATTGKTVAETAEIGPNAVADRALTGAQTRGVNADALLSEQLGRPMSELSRLLVGRAQGLPGEPLVPQSPMSGIFGSGQQLSFGRGLAKIGDPLSFRNGFR